VAAVAETTAVAAHTTRRSVLSVWRALGRPTSSDDRTLLVDYWYSHAVGHAVEALRACQAYHAGDPSLQISLVLNGSSPLELARCTPFVSSVYGAPYTSFGTPVGSPGAALRGIPRDWDHVVHHPAATDPYQARFEGLRRYYEASSRYFRARISVGVVGREPPPYVPHQQLRLELPEKAREHAQNAVGDRLAIAVMPAGSAGLRALYPSLSSWTLILDAFAARFGDVTFTFVGRLVGGKTGTVSGISREEVDRMISSREHAIDVFDRPIIEQLAAVEASGLFVSPHTGFGFAAVAVGTPWLTLSGGDWHEYFFNGVPFYSVLPSRPKYPVFARGGKLPMIEADVDGEGPRTASMGARRIADDLDTLVDAAESLVEGRISYEDALAAYVPRLVEAYGGDPSMIATFEDVHVPYL
jgi:hypothetical protein